MNHAAQRSGILPSGFSTQILPGLLAVLAVLVCVLVYGRALGGPLLFDDFPNLIDNARVQITGLRFDAWRAAVMSSDSGILHRPVAMFTFAVNYAQSGVFSPVALKATNLSIHLLNGLAIYVLALAVLRSPALVSHQWGRPQWVAMIAACLWLLHPLHVSTVLYAIQRMAQLSTLFTLLGLVVFCHFRLRWAVRGGGTGDIFAAGLWLIIFTLLAILSKENGILLPWLVLVVEVSLFRGVWRERELPRLNAVAWVLLLLPLAGLLAVLLISPEWITARFASRDFTLGERLLTQGRVLWHYLGWLLLPDITAMGFFHDDMPISSDWRSPLTTALAMFSWLALVAFALLRHKTSPLLFFTVAFFLVAHSMESSVLPLEMVFEHRNYLPSVAVCLFLAVLLARAATRFEHVSLRVAVAMVFTVITVLLLLRTQAWTDEMKLARYNVINHPASARANFFYANLLFQRFDQTRELGLEAREEEALAVASREYLERAYQLNTQKLAPIVLLYQLDLLHFPGLAIENDWLSRLETVSASKPLHANDRGALNALVSFSATPAGRDDRERIGSLLEELLQRYPGSRYLTGLQYRFIASTGDKDRTALRLELEELAAQSAKPALYAGLVRQYAVDDVGRAHENLRRWMQLDPKRRDLVQVLEVVQP